MSGISGSKAAIPNKSLKPLGILIGDWRTEGKHPGLPGIALSGNTSFKWIENGAFMQMSSSVNHEQFPDGIAIFGSDDSGEAFTMIYFDERGVSRRYASTLKDNVWTWWRNDPEFSQEFRAEIRNDGDTIISKGKMSKNGQPWEGDLELVYTRV